MLRSLLLLLLLLLLAASLLCAPASAGDIDAQAERLAALRGEVETISAELELDKADLRSRLRAVEAQTVDLEVQIRREELRLERLLTEEEKQRSLLDEAAGTEDLTPTVTAGITQLRGVVTSGLPFKVDDRLQSLSELEVKLREQTMSAEQAAARLWAFAEDERRLSRENALDRQVISLGGEEMLVDVARVGMIAMYYRRPDGGYGQAVPGDDGWRWAELTASADIAEVTALFDALSQGIRVGTFTLPQPLIGAR
jgi:hypothetical protein